jgi:CubicO group peptidase (beta-lactamase class C family)
MRVAAVLLSIGAVACGPAQSATNPAVDRLFAAWDRTDSPGCGVGVSRHGVVIYERGYGMASLERKAPITSSTVFRLASITKPFTAMSVLLAAEQGLLSLDDDVSKYVAGWSIRDHRVTIQHLLTHTSGIRDAYLLQGWATHHGTSKEALVRLLARQRGLNSPPGVEYVYNNGGYMLLGEILARASGRTLGAFADANIFKPLGMTGAWFTGDPVRTAPSHASAYSPQPNGWRLLEEGSGYAGNAGMMSSVRDLLLWANNLANTRVGTPALVARMQTATVLTGGQATGSGIGLGIGSHRGTRRLHAAGGDNGTATELALFPDHQLAVAVLCNMDSAVMGGRAAVNTTDLTNRVADVFLELPAPPPPPAGAGAGASATTPPSVTLSADDLAGKTGLYRLASDQIVSISIRDGKLTAWDYWGDNLPLPLSPVGANRFANPGFTLEFSPAAGGRPRSWHVLDGDGRRLAELPLVTFNMPKAELPAYAGEYRSDELDVTYTVAVRDAGLVVQSLALYPISKDAFVGDYHGIVRFFRDRGVASGFTLNRKGARGVRFERVK